MTSRRLAYVLSLSLFALALNSGCGGETFSDKLATAEAEFQIQADIICDCYAELQFASEADCMAQLYNPLNATERQCVIDAAALDQAASDANMDCSLAATEDYTDCLNRELVCAELNMMNNGLMTCLIALEAAINNCPTLPQDVQAASNACFPQ